MSEAEKMRMDRITYLWNELKYELSRGFMEQQIDETLSFKHVCPVSHVIPRGVVTVELRTRPITRDAVMVSPDYGQDGVGRLKVVKGDLSD